MSTTPKPNLDLFADSACLISKKCRTSTPSLKPPKPPTKSSKSARARRGYLDHKNGFQYINSDPDNATRNDGSFSFNFALNNTLNNSVSLIDEYSRLFKEFEIIGKIGSGHFADVYKVKSLKDGQYYAIKKTIFPFTGNSDRARKLQEVKNHQMLPPHPNCVRYIDSWEEDGYLYIQTELCKTSLNEILENSEDHKLPENLIWKYLNDLLLAIKHLHDHDLIHLDIKPDNIMISFDDVAKLGDFGLMCSCLDLNSSNMYSNVSDLFKTSDHSEQSRSSPNSTFTTINNDLNDSFSHQPMDDSDIISRSNESIDSIDEGDSKYLASETMHGKFTKAADIFSLGITVFEAASGLDLPQRGEVYHKLRHNLIEDPYFNGLSTSLVYIIKMMMEEDYLKRPTIDDLLRLRVIMDRKSPVSIG